MRKIIIVSLFLISLGLCWSHPVPFAAQDRENSSTLNEILEKCGEYCEKLAKAALYFVCIESIDERTLGEKGAISPNPIGEGTTSSEVASGDRIAKPSTHKIKTRTFTRSPRPSRMEKNIYVYDYQLIRKGKLIEEKRTLLEENGKKKNDVDARLKSKRFFSERSVFGPVGLLSRRRQDQYNYKVLKEEKFSRRLAVVLEATPKKTSRENPNFGKIWVDKEDFSILKIEVAQESLAGIKGVKDKRISHVVKDVHEYGVIKNGIRFPSRTIFEESYKINKVRDTYPDYSFKPTKMGLRWGKTVITYKDYKFFTVDVDVKF
jgi:hypothetical protein